LSAVAAPASTDAEERRAFRRALRNVARLLRWSGLALVVIGTVGFVTSRAGDWWVGPSWVSFALGWALMLAGVVKRVRARRMRGPAEG
jgi:hypothetical protein